MKKAVDNTNRLVSYYSQIVGGLTSYDYATYKPDYLPRQGALHREARVLSGSRWSVCKPLAGLSSRNKTPIACSCRSLFRATSQRSLTTRNTEQSARIICGGRVTAKAGYRSASCAVSVKADAGGLMEAYNVVAIVTRLRGQQQDRQTRIRIPLQNGIKAPSCPRAVPTSMIDRGVDCDPDLPHLNQPHTAATALRLLGWIEQGGRE